jgi:hypothetical protein
LELLAQAGDVDPKSYRCRTVGPYGEEWRFVDWRVEVLDEHLRDLLFERCQIHIFATV